MKIKAVSGMMLVLILVGMFNVPLRVSEIDVDGVLDDSPVLQTVDDDHPLDHAESHGTSWNSPRSQVFNGDASAGGGLGFFSPGEDAWNFSEMREWRSFACVNDNSAEVVIGVNNGQPRSHGRLMDNIRENHGEIVDTVSIGGETIAFVVNTSLMAASFFVEKVRATGLSRYIEPNIRFQAQLVPNDPNWSQQWGPVNIEADYAWNTTMGNSSVLVAVIDSGIDYNHPDLAGNYVALGYDWVNDDPDPMDDYFHGTHCAGIIAATINNNEGIAGLAQVRIMAEKGLDAGGSGWASNLANAIIHAVDQGANILSNSWGSYKSSNLIHDAVKYAQNRSVLVVASAGNDYSNTMHYPAAYDEVVAVTATDSDDNPVWFTNFGSWIDVAAPGVDIYSTISEIHDSDFDYPYDNCSGTSVACPHVAGVATLIWSEFPSLTLDEVRLRLQLTADDLGDPYFDFYYGYGRVNARRAVELLSHELLISEWKRPAYVEPGSSTTINTTVMNFGSSKETGITVQLRVNGSTVDFTHISSLESMKSTTVSCTWNPTVEGRYYVESYVVPVSGETVVENNVRQAYINVRVGKFIRVPEDCSKIQEAVDLASPGETIKVASGPYYEHVNIDVSLKLVGEDRNTTVIDGEGKGAVLLVTADNVEVRGFTVQNSGNIINTLFDGIALLGVKNCVVSNNNLIANSEGIYLDSSSNNTISGNYMKNKGSGIGLHNSYNNSIYGNNITSGKGHGIHLGWLSHENSVVGNSVTNFWWGISMFGSFLNSIVGNNVTNNKWCGIGIELGFSGNVIMGNNVMNNKHGIKLADTITISNSIIGNNITKNLYGVYIDWGANNNKFYNNKFINNTQQLYFDKHSSGYANVWDNGYPSGGNYWSDYAGKDQYKGPCQNITGRDGIGDTPYIINQQNKDNYPLTPPYSPHDIGIISITVSKTSVTQGDNLSINIKIMNYGANSETFSLTAYTNTTIIQTKNITLSSRNSTTVTFAWNTTGIAKGEYTISAHADPVPGEPDTDDNTYVDGIVTVLSPGHDATVECVAPSRPLIGQGFYLSIKVAVKNYGSFVETFNVTVYANTTVIGNQSVNNLPKGTSTNLTFTWNTISYTVGNYTIKAYAWPVPGETETTDNALVGGWVLVTVPGDVNGDGKVSIADVKIMDNAYSGVIEEPMADIDGDGRITIADAKIMDNIYSGIL